MLFMPTPLHRAPLRRPWAVWLGVLSAVLGALAPTLTHALMSARGQVAQGVEICTDQGPRWVSVDTSLAATDAVPALPSAGVSEHCQFCLQTTDRGAFLNDPLPQPFLVQDGQRAPPVRRALFYATTHTFAPPPRGPPGFF
jgi:hypothetical protein